MTRKEDAIWVVCFNEPPSAPQQTKLELQTQKAVMGVFIFIRLSHRRPLVEIFWRRRGVSTAELLLRGHSLGSVSFSGASYLISGCFNAE